MLASSAKRAVMHEEFVNVAGTLDCRMSGEWPSAHEGVALHAWETHPVPMLTLPRSIGEGVLG